jgi:hypothetical protein
MPNWFDLDLPYRRRSGQWYAGTALDLSDGYGDDPVVALAIGHPFLERGCEFLLRDVLQIALCPASDREWLRLLKEPPTPHELGTALAPYRPAFELEDPQYPAMQVRPELAPDSTSSSSAREPPRSSAGAGDDTAEEDQDGEDPVGDTSGEPLPLSRLLPEQPTKNVLDTRTDFFTHAGDAIALHGSLTLPLL